MKSNVKRAYVTIEFYNEASLDKQLSELREKLLAGVEKQDQNTRYGGYSLTFMMQQIYTNNHQREKFTSILEGKKVELVRSKI